MHSREVAKGDSYTFGCLSVYYVPVWNSWAAADLFFVKFYNFLKIKSAQKFQICLKSGMLQPRIHCKVVLNVVLEDLLQRRKRHYKPRNILLFVQNRLFDLGTSEYLVA